MQIWDLEDQRAGDFFQEIFKLEFPRFLNLVNTNLYSIKMYNFTKISRVQAIIIFVRLETN